MRIYELFHALIEKFVPMDITTKTELQGEALKWYKTQTDALAILASDNERIVKENDDNRDNPEYLPKALKKASMTNRIFQLLEQWWLRYILALAFIFIVPKLKAVINGETSSKEEDDGEDSDGDDFAAFMEYRRFKKTMR